MLWFSPIAVWRIATFIFCIEKDTASICYNINRTTNIKEDLPYLTKRIPRIVWNCQ